MEVVRVVREGVGVVFGSGGGMCGGVGEVGGGSVVVGWFELTEIVKNRAIARCRLLLVGGEKGGDAQDVLMLGHAAPDWVWGYLRWCMVWCRTAVRARIVRRRSRSVSGLRSRGCAMGADGFY